MKDAANKYKQSMKSDSLNAEPEKKYEHEDGEEREGKKREGKGRKGKERKGNSGGNELRIYCVIDNQMTRTFKSSSAPLSFKKEKKINSHFSPSSQVSYARVLWRIIYTSLGLLTVIDLSLMFV